MPVAPTYPGVYVEELPSGVHTITGVSTSVTGFLGNFSKGPLNTPTQIFSVADLERAFGSLTADSEAGYAVRQFFAAGGSEAWVVRVAKQGTAGKAQGELAGTGGNPLLQASAASEGAWGNAVRIAVDQNTPANATGPATTFNLTVTQVGTGNPPTVQATEVYRNLELDPDDPGYTHSLDAVNGVSSLVRLTLPAAAPAAVVLPQPTGTVSGDLSALDPSTLATGDQMTVEFAGGLGEVKLTAVPASRDDLAAAIQQQLTTLGAPPALPHATAVVKVDGAKNLLEISPGPVRSGATLRFSGDLATALSLDAGQQPPDITAVDLTTLNGKSMDVSLGVTAAAVELAAKPTSLTQLTSMLQSALAGALRKAKIGPPTVTLVRGQATQQLQIVVLDANPGWTLTFSGALATSLKLDNPAVAGAQQIRLAAGADGDLPDADALVGDPAAPKRGLYSLDNADFNILCLPDVMRLDDGEGAAAISAATEYCVARSAMLIVDPPNTDGTRDTLIGIQDWLDQNATLRSSYAAVYYPRPQIPDPLNGYRPRAIAGSGTIAGLYARTDASRGVWKAPAGTEATLTNVSALGYMLTDAENGVLNPLAINCLRSFPIYGNVCWGARTLEGADAIASEWKYVPVRRTALFIEASLYRGTKWVVFEPNDEPLWAQIRLNVGAFMHDLFRKGAFQGSTPSAAYLVKCDSETTTQNDINLGVVNILVGFAPLKPAEFVILQIQQLAGQIPT